MATEIHGWPQPTEGATNWHTDYYEFQDDADTKVPNIGSNTLDRPSSPSVNMVWMAVSDGEISQYDAGTDTWTMVADLTPSLSPYAEESWVDNNYTDTTTFTNHRDDTTNPHSVDYTDTGAAPSGHDNTEHSTNFATETALSDHETDETNPHNVTASQAGAAPSGHDNTEHSTNYAAETALTDHTGDTTNPHSVDYTQTGAAVSGHGNGEHSAEFVDEGDGVTRSIFVSSDGTIPSAAGNDDIVLTPDS